jgi:hypothetical protein
MAEQAMGVLRRVFGAAIPQPSAVLATKWASDPYARGASLNCWSPPTFPTHVGALRHLSRRTQAGMQGTQTRCAALSGG